MGSFVYRAEVVARSSIRSVAVVGAGPAGSYLATMLARAGIEVVVFARGKRPPLLIGESLVPAIVPFLRELGIEDEVRGYAVFKPGATWIFNPGDGISFEFKNVRKAKNPYAYNVPRDRFDASFVAAAARAGATIVEHTATVERDGDDRVRLADATMAAAALDRQPDLVVDATGRARLLSNALGLPFDSGGRRDTALFAHLEGVPLVLPGNVHTERLQRGWAWRIPLPGRVSVGIVVEGEHLRTFGDTIEEQFDNYLRSDPSTAPWAATARRLTPVVKYTNYQLVSLRGVGANWALVGDAFGFVDPVFSSGLLISLDSARELARAIRIGTPRALARYERHVLSHVRSWRRAVGYFYDGRLFTLLKVGEEAKETLIGRMLAPHFETHFPRVFTGESTTKRYSLGLLSFMCQHSLGDKDPSRLQIH